MAIQKIFAYNTGSLISGTTQVGDIAVSEADVEYSANYGGLQWWGGPDESLGYVIAKSVSGNTQPTPISGTTASLGFYGTKNMDNPFDESTFVDLVNGVFNQNFVNGSDAKTWLNNNGYWTSFTSITPTPTASPVSTTPTPTPSVTPTMYYYSVSGYSCGVSCSLVGSYTVMSPTPLTIGYFYNNPENRGYTFEILSLIPQVGGAYDLTGEPGFAVCIDACNQPSPSPTPTVTNTQTPTVTTTPTPSVTNTQTPSVTPTLTPTPSTSPVPVTGYSFNLVVLPYNYPTSGNTIMVDQAVPGSGTTNPNVFATNTNGIYFNAIDTNGVNRTSYFASFTGQSITLTISQTGSTAIYSGDSKAFQSWSSGGDSGFTFGYGIVQPGYSAGTTTLIQSAPTNWVTGQTVYISAVVNGAGVTPTPTATSVTPTPTPTSGYTSDGWLFYSPNNSPVLGPPNSNGNTAFIDAATGFGTYNPNYTGGTFNLYFNNNTSNGTSYASQFSGLLTTGGTITINQGSSTAIYSGTSTDYQTASSYTWLIVNRSAQMIQAASTPFVSGTSINVVVS